MQGTHQREQGGGQEAEQGGEDEEAEQEEEEDLLPHITSFGLEQRCRYRNFDRHHEEIDESLLPSSAFDHTRKKFSCKNNTVYLLQPSNSSSSSSSSSSRRLDREVEGFGETGLINILLLGDQNAGKSTFLHAFTRTRTRCSFLHLTSFLPFLQSSFYNARILFSSSSSRRQPRLGRRGPLGDEGETRAENRLQHEEEEEEREEKKTTAVEKKKKEEGGEDEEEEEKKKKNERGVVEAAERKTPKQGRTRTREDRDKAQLSPSSSSPCSSSSSSPRRFCSSLSSVGRRSDFSRSCFQDEPPFLDSDVGRGFLLFTFEDFLFFCSEFSIPFCVKSLSPSSSFRSRGGWVFDLSTRYVALHLLELGGDHLDRLVRFLSLQRLFCKLRRTERRVLRCTDAWGSSLADEDRSKKREKNRERGDVSEKENGEGEKQEEEEEDKDDVEAAGLYAVKKILKEEEKYFTRVTEGEVRGPYRLFSAPFQAEEKQLKATRGPATMKEEEEDGTREKKEKKKKTGENEEDALELLRLLDRSCALVKETEEVLYFVNATSLFSATASSSSSGSSSLSSLPYPFLLNVENLRVVFLRLQALGDLRRSSSCSSSSSSTASIIFACSRLPEWDGSFFLDDGEREKKFGGEEEEGEREKNDSPSFSSSLREREWFTVNFLRGFRAVKDLYVRQKQDKEEGGEEEGSKAKREKEQEEEEMRRAEEEKKSLARFERILSTVRQSVRRKRPSKTSPEEEEEESMALLKEGDEDTWKPFEEEEEEKERSATRGRGEKEEEEEGAGGEHRSLKEKSREEEEKLYRHPAFLFLHAFLALLWQLSEEESRAKRNVLAAEEEEEEKKKKSGAAQQGKKRLEKEREEREVERSPGLHTLSSSFQLRAILPLQLLDRHKEKKKKEEKKKKKKALVRAGGEGEGRREREESQDVEASSSPHLAQGRFPSCSRSSSLPPFRYVSIVRFLALVLRLMASRRLSASRGVSASSPSSRFTLRSREEEEETDKKKKKSEDEERALAAASPSSSSSSSCSSSGRVRPPPLLPPPVGEVGREILVSYLRVARRLRIFKKATERGEDGSDDGRGRAISENSQASREEDAVIHLWISCLTLVEQLEEEEEEAEAAGCLHRLGRASCRSLSPSPGQTLSLPPREREAEREADKFSPAARGGSTQTSAVDAGGERERAGEEKKEESPGTQNRHPPNARLHLARHSPRGLHPAEEDEEEEEEEEEGFFPSLLLPLTTVVSVSALLMAGLVAIGAASPYSSRADPLPPVALELRWMSRKKKTAAFHEEKNKKKEDGEGEGEEEEEKEGGVFSSVLFIPWRLRKTGGVSEERFADFPFSLVSSFELCGQKSSLSSSFSYPRNPREVSTDPSRPPPPAPPPLGSLSTPSAVRMPFHQALFDFFSRGLRRAARAGPLPSDFWGVRTPQGASETVQGVQQEGGLEEATLSEEKSSLHEEDRIDDQKFSSDRKMNRDDHSFKWDFEGLIAVKDSVEDAVYIHLKRLGEALHLFFAESTPQSAGASPFSAGSFFSTDEEGGGREAQAEDGERSAGGVSPRKKVAERKTRGWLGEDEATDKGLVKNKKKISLDFSADQRKKTLKTKILNEVLVLFQLVGDLALIDTAMKRTSRRSVSSSASSPPLLSSRFSQGLLVREEAEDGRAFCRLEDRNRRSYLSTSVRESGQKGRRGRGRPEKTRSLVAEGEDQKTEKRRRRRRKPIVSWKVEKQREEEQKRKQSDEGEEGDFCFHSGQWRKLVFSVHDEDAEDGAFEEERERKESQQETEERAKAKQVDEEEELTVLEKSVEEEEFSWTRGYEALQRFLPRAGGWKRRKRKGEEEEEDKNREEEKEAREEEKDELERRKKEEQEKLGGSASKEKKKTSGCLSTHSDEGQNVFFMTEEQEDAEECRFRGEGIDLLNELQESANILVFFKPACKAICT